MSGGIGVVVNPYSRKNRKNPEAIKKLGYIIGDKGSCEATRSLSDVERVAREFMEKGVEILALSGGDVPSPLETGSSGAESCDAEGRWTSGSNKRRWQRPPYICE